MSTKLTPKEKEALKLALLSAFPTPGALRELLMFELDLNIELVRGPNHGETIVNLMEWAESGGRTEELMTKARVKNPGNPDLQEFERAYRAARGPTPPPDRAAITLPGDLRASLIDALMAISGAQTRAGRDAWLERLPPLALRNDFDARKDVELIVDQLTERGRQDTVRPLNVLVDNALRGAGAWDGRTIDTLNDVERRLDAFYGGNASPKVDLPAYEALPFEGEDSRLPIEFLRGALDVARSVARLCVPRYFDGAHKPYDDSFGTGWIIAPGFVITNHHVIDARDYRFEAPAKVADFDAQGRAVVLWFDYVREGGERVERRSARVRLHDRDLDYAVLEIAEPTTIADRPALRLVTKPPTLMPSTRLNIVQHSGGKSMQYAIRNNFYVGTAGSGREQFLRYLTDTEPGASGSPVLDDRWQVIALHHAASGLASSSAAQTIDQPQKKVAKFHNEGIDIHAILAHIKAKDADLHRAIVVAQDWA